jgi:hypothetical protein
VGSIGARLLRNGRAAVTHKRFFTFCADLKIADGRAYSQAVWLKPGMPRTALIGTVALNGIEGMSLFRVRMNAEADVKSPQQPIRKEFRWRAFSQNS